MTTTQAAAREAAPIISDPLRPYNRRRRNLPQIQRALSMDTDTRHLGMAMANCSRILKLVMELPEAEQPRALLQGTRFCNLRLCPFCEWRRSLVWKVRLFKGLQQLHREKPTYRPLLLTLTVKNGPIETLGQQIKDLHTSFSRMRKCSFWPTDYWLRRTEVTYPLRKAVDPLHGRHSKGVDFYKPQRGYYEAHPHIHVLLVVRPSYFGRDYIKQSEWQKQWWMAARLDYPPVVDVRTITAKDGRFASMGAYLTAAQEVCKYMTKADELGALGADLPYVHMQLANQRMIQSSQALGRYINTEDIKPAELTDQKEIDASVIPSAEVLAAWDDFLCSYELIPQA